MPLIEKPGDDEDTHDANCEACSHGDNMATAFTLYLIPEHDTINDIRIVKGTRLAAC